MVTKILVPLDGSHEAEQVLAQAIEKARQLHATIYLLRIAMEKRCSGNLKHCSDMDYIWEVQHYISTIAGQVRQAGVPVEAAVRYGYAAEQILAHAALIHADLIMMSAQGASELESTNLANVRMRVANEAHCPVLAIPVVPAQYTVLAPA